MDRLHIAFFGPVNSGKSTLVNAICGQEVSLVSPLPGTTTDPVRKLAELPGLGPCVLIDTAGLDDSGILGAERERRTRAILDETDVAVWVRPPQEDGNNPLACLPSQMMGRRERKGGVFEPSVPILGTMGTLDIPVITYKRGESVESLLERIAAAWQNRRDNFIQEELAKEEKSAISGDLAKEERFLTGELVKAGDTVLLVMPQDSEAPKGRLILPQVQVLRELLDRGCVPHCCTPESLQAALGSLSRDLDLVITDSQVFALVEKAIPKDCPLTSFSVLLAGAKGDLNVFVEGAKAIDSLKPGDRVLIAEACTHVPDTEDIGRVKIPALLRKKIADQAGNDAKEAGNDAKGAGNDAKEAGNDAKEAGNDAREAGNDGAESQAESGVTPGGLQVDIAAGNDFPEDLSKYALIIHCGACVANARLVRSRIRKALLAGVPITNYGIALAKLQGILERVSLQTR